MRIRRHRRVRGKVRGTAERPRLSVFRSLRHIVAQLIDDERGKTVVSATTFAQKESEERKKRAVGIKVERARLLGKLLAEKAKAKGFTRVVFDRGGYAYHGRVRALAEGAREGGLEF